MNPELQSTTPTPENIAPKQGPEFAVGDQSTTPEIKQNGIERGAEAKEATSEARAVAGDTASIAVNPIQAVPSIPTPSLSGPLSASVIEEASDENEIEKKWVNRTQEIIASTKGDPFEREKQIVNVREEYQQKRFNRTRGDGNNQ